MVTIFSFTAFVYLSNPSPILTTGFPHELFFDPQNNANESLAFPVVRIGTSSANGNSNEGWMTDGDFAIAP